MALGTEFDQKWDDRKTGRCFFARNNAEQMTRKIIDWERAAVGAQPNWRTGLSPWGGRPIICNLPTGHMYVPFYTYIFVYNVKIRRGRGDGRGTSARLLPAVPNAPRNAENASRAPTRAKIYNDRTIDRWSLARYVVRCGSTLWAVPIRLNDPFNPNFVSLYDEQ